MRAETIPGTKAVGQRLANADRHALALIRERTSCTDDEAHSVLALLVRYRLLKLNVGAGRYDAVHGAVWEPATLARALAEVTA